MNVDAIITHLSNFQDTWKGWNGLISGLSDFFGKDVINTLNGLFENEAAGLKALFAPLSSEKTN